MDPQQNAPSALARGLLSICALGSGTMNTTLAGAACGRFWAFLCAVCAVCAVACGGRADGGDGGSGEDVTVDAGSGDDDANDPTPTGTKKTGDTALGKCHLGEPPDVSQHTCPWLAKGLCYQTKLEACACVCPADRQDSVCSSGFEDGPYGQTVVKCY